jgi:PAS domain S-box-containing protein
VSAAASPATPGSLDPGELLNRDAVRQALGALSTLIPVSLFAADADGTCWYVNQRLIDSLGLEIHSREERPFRLAMPGGAIPTEGLSYLEVTASDFGSAGDESDSHQLGARVMPLVTRTGATSAYLGVVVDPDADGSVKVLQTSERLVDALMDRSPEVITILNADGTWRYSNATAWRLLGYQSEFDPADGILGLVHPDDLHVAANGLERLRAGHGVGSDPIELRVRAADGTWRYLESLIEDLVDDPVVHGYLIRSRDVTERRHSRLALLEANERLSTLISSMHLAVLMEDEARHIVFTNEAFVSLFELPVSAEQLVGRTIEELGPEFFRRFGDPTGTSEIDRAEALLRERRPVIGDRIAMMDNRVLERDYLPIVAGGEYRGHVWIFRDVSAQARAEAAWELLIARQRGENERLLELDRIKAGFLAEISHELRTPLTSILSFTELLADGLGKDDAAEQAEFLEIIRRNADRLLRLVDDLLLLDRLESGAMPLEWGVVDLPSLLTSCVAGFTPSAEAKGIFLSCEIGEGPAVAGDQDRLSQVIDVLLSNAVKFTPEGGRVTVTAEPQERLWRIEVTDTGIGVPSSEQESLFERFFRATNARASRIPGSGLGLAVARVIVELHGGSVVLRSAIGRGTTVSITLPLPQGNGSARAGTEAEAEAAAEAQAARAAGESADA